MTLRSFNTDHVTKCCYLFNVFDVTSNADILRSSFAIQSRGLRSESRFSVVITKTWVFSLRPTFDLMRQSTGQEIRFYFNPSEPLIRDNQFVRALVAYVVG